MIQQYINYLSNIKGYSPNTCLAYEKDLKDFARWASVNVCGARWSTLTRDDIDHYVYYMVDLGLKPATTNRRISAISSIYNYFRRQGYEVVNPCKYESRRKNPKTIPNTIPTNELHTAYSRAEGVTKVMLGLLMTTGLRIQELLDLRMEDINFDTQAIRVRGKGSKERVVYSRPEQLDTLRMLKANGQKSGLIFKVDQRTARHMIWESLKDVSSAAQLSPHAIRHTFATELANNGINVTTIAGILGHNKIQTTQQYIDMSQADTRTACQQYAIFN